LEISEVLRLLRAGEGDRRIVGLLGLNRRTVAKYRSWAKAQGLLEGSLPALAKVQALLDQTMPKVLPPQQTSTVAEYQGEIAELRARGMEIAAIRTRLEERHQKPISYSAIWRLLKRTEPSPIDPTVRVETKPGEEAQVDFGFAGWAIDPRDGKARKAWVFVMVLSWSRYLFAKVVFDQRVETWLLCHRQAFEFFGGVPRRIVPDNLKSAIGRACLHEPTAQRAYRECAEHYGFLIDPNPPRSPNLKGKVEGGVHYVKRNFLAGREPEPEDQLNVKLRAWCEQVAGQRIHGTTRQTPLGRFQSVEKAALLALPREPYDLAVWARLTVHRDCHLTFERSYYSAPFRFVGKELWVRGGIRTVSLYGDDHQLVATHDRARVPGTRQTILAHLPPEKVPNLVLTREDCRRQAAEVGPAAEAIVTRLLEHRPEDRLRVAGRLLRLADTYGQARLERACARAEAFGEVDYVGIKRILEGGLDREALPEPVAARRADSPRAEPRVFAFARSVDELVAGLIGGGR
jgi:transposase